MFLKQGFFGGRVHGALDRMTSTGNKLGKSVWPTFHMLHFQRKESVTQSQTYILTHTIPRPDNIGLSVDFLMHNNNLIYT